MNIVNNPHVISGYGRRTDPISGRRGKQHSGIDLRGNKGDPIFATRDLKIVTASSTTGGFGKLVKGVDNQGNTHYFGHLSGFNTQVGQQVKAGQQIGRIGSTGRSTGNHLHFGVKNRANKWINPNRFLKGAVSKGKSIANKAINKAVGSAIAVAASSNPLVGAVVGGLNIAGVSLPGQNKCGWICQIRKWFDEAQIIQRIALVMIALIFIGGALYLFGTGQTKRVMQSAIKV